MGGTTLVVGFENGLSGSAVVPHGGEHGLRALYELCLAGRASAAEYEVIADLRYNTVGLPIAYDRLVRRDYSQIRQRHACGGEMHLVAVTHIVEHDIIY